MAEKHPTTGRPSAPRTPATASPAIITPPASGDALLLGLAAAFRAARDASEAFEIEAARWDGTMERYLQGHQEEHAGRCDTIAEALCAIPADGMAGAMIQLETLFIMRGWDAAPHAERWDRLREHAMRSIFSVLSNASGRTSEDGLGILHTYDDPFRTDLPQVLEELKLMIAQWGFALQPRTPKQQPAKAA